MVVHDVTRLGGHILRLESQFGQLAPGQIPIDQHQVVNPVDEAAAGLVEQGPGEGADCGHGCQNLICSLRDEGLCCGIALPVEFMCFAHRCNLSVNPFSVYFFLSLSLLWPGETLTVGSMKCLAKLTATAASAVAVAMSFSLPS